VGEKRGDGALNLARYNGEKKIDELVLRNEDMLHP
jgi:hypothetical protein